MARVIGGCQRFRGTVSYFRNFVKPNGCVRTVKLLVCYLASSECFYLLVLFEKGLSNKRRGCTNTGGGGGTKFHKVVPNVFRSSICNCLRITLLIPTILRRLTDILENLWTPDNS
jgi:hypothetical protein